MKKSHLPTFIGSFADDEETLLSPCLAHANWKREQQLAFISALRKHYDTQIANRQWLASHRDSLVIAFERALLDAMTDQGI